MTWFVRPWLISAVGSTLVLLQSACTPMSRDAVEVRTDPDVRAEPAASADKDTVQTMLEKIRADAAGRANVARDAVKVLSTESVNWADASLGCPEPRMSYTQMIVRGYLIHVDAGGTVLTYHANATGAFVQCPPDRERPPAPGDPT